MNDVVHRIVCAACGHSPQVIKRFSEDRGSWNYYPSRYICKHENCRMFMLDLSWHNKTLSGKAIKRHARRRFR